MSPVKCHRIELFLMSDGGRVPVSGIDHGVLRQCKQLIQNGLHQLGRASGGQIRAPVGVRKQRIPGQQHALVRNVIAGRSGCVPRRRDQFPVQPQKGKLLAVPQQLIRVKAGGLGVAGAGQIQAGICPGSYSHLKLPAIA